MAQLKELLSVDFETSYYVCDKCRDLLLPGSKGNICVICQGNFCEKPTCIGTVDIPGKGKEFVCCFCRAVTEHYNYLAVLEGLERNRQVVMQGWMGQSASPALKKEGALPQ